MRGQAVCPTVGGRRPPRQAALGKSLVAEPESLAVIHEQLQRRRLAIAENKDGAGEGVVLEGLLTEPRQAVDAASEIGRLDAATRIFIWGVIWSITGRSRSCVTAPRCPRRRSRPVARAWWRQRRCRARTGTVWRPLPEW